MSNHITDTRKSYIYALVDPITEEIRYVGKCVCPPSYRLKQHIWYSRKSKDNYHVYNWMRKLDRDGYVPKVTVLEECFVYNASERETFWIAHGKENRWSLTNMTNGGDGVYGHRHTEETLRKISEKNKGRKWTQEQRDKMSIQRKGKKFSQEHKQNIRDSKIGNKNAVGATRSEETRRKMSVARRSKLTEKDVIKIRSRLANYESATKLSKEYGVSLTLIRKIRDRECWNYINEENVCS